MTYTNPNTGNTNTIGDVSTADNARTIRENQVKLADNSEQISEDLEIGDSLNDYDIIGELNSFSDRDGYVMWFEGNTTFVIDNSIYSNNPFYLNLYNEDTHELLASFNDDETTIVLPKGQYRVTFSFSSDTTGIYYTIPTIEYTTNITTEYINLGISPSIISYLLN